MTLQDELGKIIDENQILDGSLLPILHAIQDRIGYIPPEAEPLLASALRLSSTEIRGVVSFYHDFRSSLAGTHRIKICSAEACQARGSRNLVSHAVNNLDINFGAITKDGQITLDKVYCLGNCASGPSVSVNGKVYANVDSNRFDELVTDILPEQQ